MVAFLIDVLRRGIRPLPGLLLLTWTTQALAQTPLYLLDSDFSSPTFIFSVDKISGQIAEVGQVPNPTGEVLALAAANANLLYSSTAEGQDQDIAAISAITVSPFLVIPIGNVAGKLIGMAFSSEGDLYAIDELTEELSLIQLAPTLGQTVIGQVHLGSPSGPVLNLDGADIVEDGNGVWYLWTNITQDLFLLDVTTAVASQLDPVNSGLGRLSGLAFDYQAGELFGSSGPLEALLTLDPSTGVILDAVNFCTTCPTTVYNHRLGDMASPHCADDDDDDSSPEGGACGAIDCNDANGAIHPNAAEVCNNADDNCDGMVDEEPAASVSCSDSNACNGVETCTAGTCTGGPPPNCNDGNVCTDDLCIPVSGCSNPFNTAPCSDQNACTTIDQCAAGECVGNTPPNCSDGNVCTDDSCNPGIGCVTTNNTAPCDDGAYCTVNDTCAAGACAPGTPRDCTASGGQCNNGICNETIDQCVAQPKPDATPCSDGNQCTLDDACVSGICQGDAMTCGDGVLQASCGEECDDGDLDPGDGCSPTCTLEPCGPAPIADCRRPIVAEKSLIALKNGAPDSKDRLHWLWVKGAVTPKADFGDPRVATSYQLCIYDSTPTLLLSANAPAASTCNPSKPKPCWQQTRKGFKYMDKELTPGGLYKIILAEGLEPRRAKITVSGKGALLGVNGVPMPIGDLPLTIQLKSSDGVCWETTHPTAKKNTPVQFRARSD